MASHTKSPFGKDKRKKEKKEKIEDTEDTEKEKTQVVVDSGANNTQIEESEDEPQELPKTVPDSTPVNVKEQPTTFKRILNLLTPSKKEPPKTEPLMSLDESAQKRTEEMREDVKTYEKFGPQACNGTILFHMTDRWTRRIRKDFFGRSFQFQATFQKHLSSTSYGEINSIEEAAKGGLQFFENLEEYQKNLTSLKAKLETSTSVNRKPVVEETVDFCDSLLKQISRLDRFPNDSSRVQAKVSELKQRNSKTEFSIVVVGLEKAGKSTTLNAIFGIDLLPSELKRCTLVITHIRSSSDNQFHVKVCYRSDTELDSFLADPELKLDDNQVKTIKTKSAQFVKKGVEQHHGSTLAGVKDFIINHVKEEAMQYVVREVELSVPGLKLGSSNVVFTDTPGTDSKIRAHAKITKQMMDQADACLYVKRGSQPTENEAAAKISNDLHEKEADIAPENTQPAIDFGSAPKSKIFVALTHLDLRTEKRIRTAIDACLEELKGRFDPNNIVPLDSRYGLLKQLREPTIDERSELADYQASPAFKDGGILVNGLNTLIDKMAKFIAEELPKARVNDALQCLKNVLSLFDQARIHVQKQASTADELKAKLSNRKDEKIKQMWNERIKTAEEEVNEWLYTNFLNKYDEHKIQWESLFKDSFSHNFDSVEAFPNDLRALIKKERSFLLVIPLDPIENKERDRLLNYHLERAEDSCGVVANNIWNFLSEFAAILPESLGSGVNYDWHINDVLQFEECKREIESQAMRVLYPLAFATIRWPVAYEGRKFAVRILHSAAPELFYDEKSVAQYDNDKTSETGVLKIPVGPTGILQMGHALGFLPGWIAPVATVVKSVTDNI